MLYRAVLGFERPVNCIGSSEGVRSGVSGQTIVSSMYSMTQQFGRHNLLYTLTARSNYVNKIVFKVR